MATRARRRIHGRERRVQPDRRIGVEQAHAVRSDQPASGVAHPLHECRLARLPLGVALGEACTDDANGADVLPDAVVNRVEHLRGGDDNHRQVDWHRDIRHACVGA